MPGHHILSTAVDHANEGNHIRPCTQAAPSSTQPHSLLSHRRSHRLTAAARPAQRPIALLVRAVDLQRAAGAAAGDNGAALFDVEDSGAAHTLGGAVRDVRGIGEGDSAEVRKGD